VAAAERPAAEPVAPLGKKVTVQAGNRQLTLSNLDKLLFPDGFTKGEIIIHRINQQHHLVLGKFHQVLSPGGLKPKTW